MAEKELFVEENQDVELKCMCSGCIPILHYDFSPLKKGKDRKYTKNKINDEKNDKFTSILEIKNVQIFDDGVFECLLKNAIKMNKFKIKLTVQSKPREMLIMSPQLKSSDKSTTFKINEFKDLTFNCIAKAYPNPTITWYKDGTKISEKSLNLTRENMIKNAGNYLCVAKNKVGEDKKSIKVEVEIPPVIQGQKNQMKDIKINSEVSLNCDIKGYPIPEINWFKGGNKLEKSTIYELSKENSILTFKGTQDKVGTFSCAAENSFGKETMSFSVFIKGPPYFDNPKDENVKIQSGKDLKLTCGVSGYPKVRHFILFLRLCQTFDS